MNKIGLVTKLIVTIMIISFLLAFTGCTKKQIIEKATITEVASFLEDTPVGYKSVDEKVQEIKLNSISVKDVQLPKVKNVWVTKSFIINNHLEDRIKNMINNGYKIFIQEYRLTSKDAYEMLKIDQRVIKDNISDVKAPLQRRGVVMVKYNNSYYAIGFNSINNNLKDIVGAFETNEKTLFK